MPSRRSLTAVAVSVLAVAGGLSALPEAAGAAGTWRVQNPVVPSATVRAASYVSVATVSASSAWAVGSADRRSAPSTVPLVAHWTGGSWRRVTPPSAASGPAYLDVVRATRAAGVWVVGGAQFAGRPDFNDFVSHRSGGGWTTHDLGAGARNADVRILGADDVWVLYVRRTNLVDVGRGAHWDGRTWTDIRLPARPTGGGSGRWAAATSDANVPRLLHWTGSRWVVVAGPRTARSSGAYYGSLLVRGSSLFVSVSYDGGEQSTPGFRLFERDARGVWRQRLWLPKELGASLTRTSSTGLWLLSRRFDRNKGLRRVLHVVGGKVVSSTPAPRSRNRSTYLSSLSGTVHSRTLFTVGQAGSGGDAAVAATYRP